MAWREPMAHRGVLVPQRDPRGSPDTALFAGEDSESTPRRLPPALERWVRPQREHYSAVDETVWRFTLAQLRVNLRGRAHPAFEEGLRAMGITARAVPRIDRISEALTRVGWQAACVDGFVPPAVFKAFQARGLLPIAGDVRPPTQVSYTPAPDIIHEAVGHAPLLIVREYADYLRAIGREGRRAFADPADGRVDTAVRRLSQLKLRPLITREELQSAEEAVQDARAASTDSEAERLSRLYWWTAEYGLLGTLSEYVIIGAGLLSSLSESHFCHEATVTKRMLSAESATQGFDITRAQPRLYVARDFAHLHEVLQSVASGLAYRAGGQVALLAAIRSRQPCTVALSDGIRVNGVLAAGSPVCGKWLQFEPGARILLQDAKPEKVEGPLVVPLGPLADGRDPARLRERSFGGEPLRLRYANGLQVRGRSSERMRSSHSLLALVDSEVRIGERSLVQTSEPWPLLLSGQLITAEAGSDNWQTSVPFGAQESTNIAGALQRWPVGRAVSQKMASPRFHVDLSTKEERTRALYTRVGRLPRGAVLPAASLYASIRSERSEDWLLLWTLLERLDSRGNSSTVEVAAPRHQRLRLALIARIRSDLQQLEIATDGREPIASALATLSRRAHNR